MKMILPLTALLVAAPALATSPYGVQGAVSVVGTSADCTTAAAGVPSTKAVVLDLRPAGSNWQGAPGAEIEISGTFSGTWQLNGSTDGVTWRAIPAIISTNYSLTSSTTVVANMTVSSPSSRFVCMFASVVSSGTFVFTIEPRPGTVATYVMLGAQGSASGNVLQAGTATAMGVSSTSNGALIVTPAGDKPAIAQPGVTTQASASAAAGGASVRHIATSCSVSISTVAAQPDIVINLRDGATGAGTIIWTGRANCAIGTVCMIVSPPLNLVGTANTALTCETATAPAINNFATASLTYHDAT